MNTTNQNFDKSINIKIIIIQFIDYILRMYDNIIYV